MRKGLPRILGISLRLVHEIHHQQFAARGTLHDTDTLRVHPSFGHIAPKTESSVECEIRIWIPCNMVSFPGAN